ncbi:putative long-chain-fatty-acid-CoA ligase [Leptomonas seymouri]|uniref:Putative long-chain-fatty-acid-CoA ligase n=1 Tax=Leptomonas seymouri TaxID=5684 RepID=A0A0N1PDV0_LEPSE|nr:putative long-chain-fatty-acid-CoA ligase [Leptomonas seymouri]|eukprot:KPI86148.1 putative long-chain-fatty-acid-CoA ligase [Leptomonas seymouri]
MGALLVTLLQCRSNQTLYPNVCATQGLQVTCQRPCSVPLITPHAHRRQPSLLPEAVAVNHDDTSNAPHHRAPIRASPSSSEQEAHPDLRPHRLLALGALGNPTEKSGAIPNVASVSTDENVIAAGEDEVLEQQRRQEQLCLGLTCPPGFPEDAEGSKQASNAIYRYTLPGAPPHAAVTPSIHSTALAAATHAVIPLAGTVNCPPLPPPACGTHTSPYLDDGQSTQQGGDGDSHARPARRHPPRLTAVLVFAAAAASHPNNNGDARTTPRSRTPLRLSQPGGAGSRNGCRHSAIRNSESEERATIGPEDDSGIGGVMDDADEELGPMDCADAFQYFYGREEAYRDVESIVYAAPSRAALATRKGAVRNFYLTQRVALRGNAHTSLAAEEWPLTPPPGIPQDPGRDAPPHHPSAAASLLAAPAATSAAMDDAVPPRAAAAPLGQPTDPSLSLQGAGSLHPLGNVTNIINYDNNARPSLDNTVPTSGVAQAEGRARARGICVDTSAHPADAAFDPAEKLPSDAGRFVSLVEEMYVTCRRIGHAPVVCWRSVDRITALPVASRSFFGMGGGTNNAANSALQNARGEVEDDVSHLPGASDATVKAAPQRRTAVGFFKSYSHKSSGKEDFVDEKTRSDAARASLLYYLGPQQYITASVWWSRVEAFGCGLRSIGLCPGDYLAIVEDTRWEWLVTCYAAWSTGLVVVAFDASDRTMRRVAVDTHGEMKAVVCNPQVHRRLRRHFQVAAAQAAQQAEEEASKHIHTGLTTGDSRSSNWSVSDERSVGNCSETASVGNGAATAGIENVCRSDSIDRSRPVGAAASTSASTTAPSRLHLKQSPPQGRGQQQQQHTTPLFIIARSVVPARDEEERRKACATNPKGRSDLAAPTDAGASPTSAAGSGSRRGRRGRDADAPPQHENGVLPRTTDDDTLEDSDEEDEEALWWSDILSYGEAELAAWRQRKAREWRQFQRAQARMRLQQQQRQRWARSGMTAYMDANETRDLSGPAAALRQQQSGMPANSALSAVGSRDGSANSTCITAPAVVSTAATARSTPAITAVMANASAAAGVVTSASTAPTTALQQLDAMGSSGGGSVPGFAHASSSATGGPCIQRTTPMATPPFQARTPSPQHARTTPPFHMMHSATSPFVGPGPATPPATAAAQSAQHNSSSVRSATQPPLTPLRADDLAFILYTEGEPKGVLLTHGAVKASMVAHQEYIDTTDIGVDDGLQKGGGGWGSGGNIHPMDSHSSSSNTKDRNGGGESGANGDGRLSRSYASARMPALRSRTAPAGRPSYLAYLPLHHISEFMAQTTFLIRGVLVCYGTRRTLFDDFALPHGDLTEYKPTVFPALPATLARLHRAVQAMLFTGYRKLLFEAAYEARRQAIRRGLQSPFVLSTIFAQPRELLGGRCRLVLSREAPLHPRDQEYVEVVCGVSVVQQYGPAETAGCGLQQAYCVGHLGTVGGPLGPTQVKLRDVASGWTHLRERPTGELLLSGPTIMAGYYRQPELTAEVLEKCGWFHSRMIAERCPDGAFRLIASLRPHHACTSNGQHIDLEKLEARYGSHPLCAPGGICLLVHPYRRYICGLVISNEARVRAFVQAQASASASAGASVGVGGGDRPSTALSQRVLSPSFSTVAPSQASPLSSPCAAASPLTALASASAEPGWWPQCLRDPALHTAAAKSLVAWVSEDSGSSEGDLGGAVAPHERVRHVRVLNDVWSAAQHTRTVTGRLFRYGLHCRYSGVIYELFSEPD